jgi:hypothetical protein
VGLWRGFHLSIALMRKCLNLSISMFTQSNFMCDRSVVFFGMVFNATFNNISVISWRAVLLVEET